MKRPLLNKLGFLFLTALLTVTMTAGIVAPLIAISGCASANRTAFVAETGARVTVQAAMQLWRQQFVIPGKATAEQERQVRDAYNKVRVSFITLCETAATAAASAGSVTNVGSGISASFEVLAAAFDKDRADLFTLLRTFGVKGV